MVSPTKAGPNVYPFPSGETQRTHSEWRVVRELRGDCITGFRVQRLRFDRHMGESRWRNVGRRVFDIGFAREMLVFYRTQAEMTAPEIKYEEV